MIAGRLNEQIKIYSPIKEINEYGERVETYKFTYTTRARVDYDNGNRSNENNEIVYNYGKTFNVRSYTQVKETCIIEWQGKRYRILTIENRREYNDMIIRTELINE